MPEHVAPEREASDREIIAEFVHTAAWSAILDVLRTRVKSLKIRVFNSVSFEETMQARYAHNEIKTFVHAVYAKAQEPIPSNVTAIFE